MCVTVCTWRTNRLTKLLQSSSPSISNGMECKHQAQVYEHPLVSFYSTFPRCVWRSTRLEHITPNLKTFRRLKASNKLLSIQRRKLWPLWWFDFFSRVLVVNLTELSILFLPWHVVLYSAFESCKISSYIYTKAHTHIHMHTYTYMYAWVCMNACVFVLVPVSMCICMSQKIFFFIF